MESTSLYGTEFSVGAVVIEIYERKYGKAIEIKEKFILKSLEGERNATDWVKENVVPYLKDIESVETDRELRDRFWDFYNKHKDCEIWADVCYPVETNFLTQVCKDDLANREFSMPYPLRDISSILPVDIDRIEYSGLTDLKKHNPLDDSLASAYSLINKIYE